MLNLATMTYLQSKGREVAYKPGEFIVRRGEKGRALSVIIAGEAEVRLPTAAGGTMTVCRLSAGEPIGEISLLRDAPTTADVVAVGQVSVIEIGQDQLQEVLTECEPLRRDLMARLATNVQRATVETWHQHERAETFAALAQESDNLAPIVAESAGMRKVVKRVAELAAESTAVVIEGEPGSGKRLAAKHIHFQSDRASEPLIVIDCADLSDQARNRLLASLSPEPSQDDQDDEIGTVKLAPGGTRVLRNVDALGVELERLLAGSLKYPDVRLILTRDQTAAHENERGLKQRRPDVPFEILRIPPLRQRRRDIVSLANSFLAEREEGHSFEESAKHALVQLHYRRGNVSELKEVVELAARCTEGARIGAEQIFGGIEDGARPEGFDVSRQPLIDGIARRGWISPLRAMTALGFAAVIAVCLWIPLSSTASLANGFIWGLWEPAVFALFLLAGPVWCTVCPLSTVGRSAQRLLSLGRVPPLWLRRTAPYLAPIGFYAIIWSELVFGMTTTPPASAIMLLCLVAASVLCCLVYSREVWCAFLCPLGRLATSVAPAAPIAVTADPQICTSTCETHDCYRGSGDVPGCSVYHHPQQALDAHRCKFCLDCLRSCPHDSATLRLRAPLRGAWRLGASATWMMPFALSVCLLTPLLLATQIGLGLNIFLVTSAIALGAGLLAAKPLGGILVPEEHDDASTPPRVAIGLLILGWGPLIAYQLGHVPLIADLQLTAIAGSPLESLLPPVVSVLHVFQVATILLAAAFAGFVLLQSRRRAHKVLRARWAVLQLAVLAYVVGSLAIVVFGSSGI